MAKLQIVDHYDKENKPVYRKMTNDEFKNAATTLSQSFGTFIDEMLKGFGYDSANAIRMALIMDALFPTSLGGLINKPSIKELFMSLNKFVDVIQKTANMQMVDSYDKDGKPIYKKMSDADFKSAATTLSTAFSTFVTELLAGFGYKSQNAKLMKEIMDALFPTSLGGLIDKPSIKDLFNSLGVFVDVI